MGEEKEIKICEFLLRPRQMNARSLIFLGRRETVDWLVRR
jgi:hypothetical protein